MNKEELPSAEELNKLHEEALILDRKAKEKINEGKARSYQEAVDEESEPIRNTDIESFTNSPELIDLNARITELRKSYPPSRLNFPNLSNEEFRDIWDKYISNPNREKELAEAELKYGGDLLTLETHYEWQRNKNAGLDPDSLTGTRKKIFEFWGEKEDSNISTTYYPDVALITRLYGNNLTGRTIIEVGPGREGISVLAYLASLGANTIAIDIQPFSENFLKEHPNVKFLWGRWENLEKLVKDQKVDLIYTHNMHPNPEAGGEFDDGTNAGKKRFEEHTRQIMDRVLKPGGIYMGHHVESDFVLFYPPEYIEQNKYKENSFSQIIEDGFQGDIINKRLAKMFGEDECKRLNIEAKLAPFYGSIVLIQKSE
jgi:hypothetical protein